MQMGKNVVDVWYITLWTTAVPHRIHQSLQSESHHTFPGQAVKHFYQYKMMPSLSQGTSLVTSVQAKVVVQCKWL